MTKLDLAEAGLHSHHDRIQNNRIDHMTYRLLPNLFAAATLMFAVTGFVPSQAVAEKTLSPAEREAFENVIRDYLLKNPEVVVDAIKKYQADQEASRDAEAKRMLSTMRDQLENAATSPSVGNPDGDVTIVEFFDYRCGYCKRVHDDVTEAVKADGKVRLVFKELPILGPDSVMASRAALGVFYTQPDKYRAFHNAMMESRGELNEDRVMDLAAGVGLNPADVKKAMMDPKVEQEIQHNMALAQALNINGTPAFIIGNNLVPGAIDHDALMQLIAEARGG